MEKGKVKTMREKYSIEDLAATKTVLDKSTELWDILFDEDEKGNHIGDAASFLAGMSIGMTKTLSLFIIRQYIKHQYEEREEQDFSLVEADEMDKYVCPHCGAVLNEQEGFDPEEGSWICKKCGQKCVENELFYDDFGNLMWYCDECGSPLNDQEGFTEKEGTWKCRVCGHINDVCKDDIIDTSK